MFYVNHICHFMHLICSRPLTTPGSGLKNSPRRGRRVGTHGLQWACSVLAGANLAIARQAKVFTPLIQT